MDALQQELFWYTGKAGANLCCVVVSLCWLRVFLPADQTMTKDAAKAIQCIFVLEECCCLQRRPALKGCNPASIPTAEEQAGSHRADKPCECVFSIP